MKEQRGGLHKFDEEEVDVYGGNATADDLMDAFGFGEDVLEKSVEAEVAVVAQVEAETAQVVEPSLVPPMEVAASPSVVDLNVAAAVAMLLLDAEAIGKAVAACVTPEITDLEAALAAAQAALERKRTSRSSMPPAPAPAPASTPTPNASINKVEAIASLAPLLECDVATLDADALRAHVDALEAELAQALPALARQKANASSSTATPAVATTAPDSTPVPPASAAAPPPAAAAASGDGRDVPPEDDAAMWMGMAAIAAGALVLIGAFAFSRRLRYK